MGLAQRYVEEACWEPGMARFLVLAHTDSMAQQWKLTEAVGKAMHHD